MFQTKRIHFNSDVSLLSPLSLLQGPLTSAAEVRQPFHLGDSCETKIVVKIFSNLCDSSLLCIISRNAIKIKTEIGHPV